MLTRRSLKGRIPLVDFSRGQLSMIWAALWLTSRKRSQKPVCHFFSVYIKTNWNHGSALFQKSEGYNSLCRREHELFHTATYKFARVGAVTHGDTWGCWRDCTASKALPLTWSPVALRYHLYTKRAYCESHLWSHTLEFQWVCTLDFVTNYFIILSQMRRNAEYFLKKNSQPCVFIIQK